MKLRPYQEAALAKIPEKGACVVALPTGTGKTIVFSELAKTRGGRTLILAHRDELIRQAVDKVKLVWPTADVGVIKAEENEVGRDVVVGSVQTLSRENRLGDYLRATKACSVTLITDEAHHGLGESYKRIYRGLNGQVSLHVGFTATPWRTDAKDLKEVFPQGIVYHRSLLEMIRDGYLCNLRATQVSLNVDLSGVRVKGGDFSEEDLGKALRAPGASEEIARAYVENARPRKALCFTASVAQAHDVAEKLVNMGVSAATVWGEQGIEDRRATLKRFSEGALSVIVNCGVLLEGYDEPSIECVMVARPTLSKLLYTQMVGRGTRLYPGKSDCLILDFVSASSRHSLETMASMFQITEKSAEQGIEALLARAKEAEEKGLDAVTGSEVTDVDLWAPPVGRLHWIPDGRRFLLSVGEVTLALSPAGLTWDIKEFGRGREGVTRKLYSGLTLEYAQGVAEDLVRQGGAWALAAEGAPWRMAPPSDGQRKVYLERGWGEPRTRGAASDRMTVEFNRRRA